MDFLGYRHWEDVPQNVGGPLGQLTPSPKIEDRGVERLNGDDHLKLWATVNGNGEVSSEVTVESLEEHFAEDLETLKTDGRKWVVIIAKDIDAPHYVQVLINPDSGFWPECVSNEYLKVNEKWTNE